LAIAEKAVENKRNCNNEQEHINQYGRFKKEKCF